MRPTAKTRARSLIAMTCEYSGGPGLEWCASAELVNTPKGLQVIQKAGEEFSRTHRLPRGQTQKSAWRLLARYLSRNSVKQNDWSIPEEALSEVVVTGIQGWHADVLALCWTRFGNDKEWSPGKLLLSFPDDWLAKEARRLGCLIPKHEARNRHHQTLRELRFLEWVMEGVARPETKLVALSCSLRCERVPFPLGHLVQQLHKRYHQFARYEDIAEATAEEAVGPYSGGGYASGMGRRMEIDELVEAVRRVFVREGQLPKSPFVHHAYSLRLNRAR